MPTEPTPQLADCCVLVTSEGIKSFRLPDRDDPVWIKIFHLDIPEIKAAMDLMEQAEQEMYRQQQDGNSTGWTPETTAKWVVAIKAAKAAGEKYREVRDLHRKGGL